MPEEASSAPFLSVVVLNWNTLALLRENLRALGAQTCRDLEVLVVDNGSRDGSLEWLKGEEPGALLAGLPLKVLALPENRGFAGGMNAGLRLGRGEWLLPLNVDVFLAPDFCAAARAAAERLPQASALGPLVFRCGESYERTEEVLCTHMVPTRLLSLTTPLDRPYEETRAFGPAGCAPLFRRAALAAAALPPALSASGETEYYDERYFAYGEDTDLYLRLRLLGLATWYVPALRCWHVHSGSQAGVRWYCKGAATLGRLPANAFDSCLKNLAGLRLWTTWPPLLLAPLAMALLLLFRAPGKCLAPLAAYPAICRRLGRTLALRRHLRNSTNNK